MGIAAIAALILKWGVIVWQVIQIIMEIREHKATITDPLQAAEFEKAEEEAIRFFVRYRNRRPLLELRARLRNHCWGPDCRV